MRLLVQWVDRIFIPLQHPYILTNRWQAEQSTAKYSVSTTCEQVPRRNGGQIPEGGEGPEPPDSDARRH